MGTSDSRILDIDSTDPEQLKQRGDAYVKQAEDLLEDRPFYKSAKHAQEDAAESYIQAANSYKLSKQCVYHISILDIP
jgi:hypothetical protein